MLYQAYQAHSDMMAPIRAFADMAATMRRSLNGFADGPFVANLTAAFELIARAGLTHVRPPFGIDSVSVGNREVDVHERAEFSTPFGTLLHFKKDVDIVQPRVLLVAPLSGHFATLLRGTVRTMLPEHDVYITDWHNAREVSLEHGRFGFDEYIDHIVSFLEKLGPGAHLVAVCQPCVAALVAAAVMAQDGNPAQPRSMTLMAGPIDTRVNPTKVNELAKSKPIDWFERTLIGTVPARYGGAFRRVYPGFVQLAAFMSMNLDRHVKAHRELYEHLVNGEVEKAEAIRRTMLLTVEGERDDICAVGQTVAAHDMCGGLRPYLKRHHMQAGVGHYGVFSGQRWTSQIYPIVKNVILASD
jgi:poly(3-hydroxybutyrate) depolymerase